MLVLNIILLIASVALMVVGLILTWKSNPSYLTIYPDMKVKIFYFKGMFFLFFLATFLGLLIHSVDSKTTLIIGVTCSFLSAALFTYTSWYYRNCSKEAMEKQRKERTIGSIYAVFFAIIIFISLELSLILSIPLFIHISYYFIKYERLKLHVYRYFIVGQLFIFLFYLSIAFKMSIRYGFKILFLSNENVMVAQSIILFLILLFMFLFILDIKKHSPIYEKQYIEENSLQPNVSNNP